MLNACNITKRDPLLLNLIYSRNKISKQNWNSGIS